MALTNIPAIWSGQTLAVLRSTIVFGAPGIANRNYQGEITQQGDRVRVTGVTDPTIFDITPNTDIAAPETLGDTVTELVINKNKGFNFQVDDLDQLQNAVKGIALQSAANAARKLAEAADLVISTQMAADVAAGNTVGSTASPIPVDAPVPGAQPATGASYAYNVLVKLGVKLDKKNVPQAGRWVVLPPFMIAALGLDPRFTLADPNMLRNGFAGRAAGFDVYSTNSVPSPGTGKYQILAGSPIATSFAEQLVQVKFYEPERRFAQAVKGQHVYGAKTFYPQALAMATVSDVSGLDS